MANFPVREMARINEFSTKLEGYIKAFYETHYPHSTPPTIELEPGKKFVRVVRRVGAGDNRHVHCFIEIASGDIYKAASFKVPAKHVRGNIFADDFGIGSAVSVHGARYL